MQEDPSVNQRDANPLMKEVAGHLFTFEEKIFGMTLTQLLMDLGAFTGSFSFTGALPLLARLMVCALITLCAMILIHSKVQGVALGYWLYLLLRFHLIPKKALWRPLSLANSASQQKGKSELPSVQATWVPIDSLSHGVAGKQTPQKHGERIRSWMVFEVEGKNIRLLPESEQVRTFRRFERFLTGLEFHLQFVSWTQQVDPLTAPGVLAQKEALGALAATPHLQALQRASLAAQQRTVTTCSSTRHVVIVSASSTESLLQNPDGSFPPVLAALWRLLPFRKVPQVSRAHVLDQLRIRSSVVRKAIQQLDLRIWPLEDQEILSCLAQCLAPGGVELSFLPELMDVPTSPPQKQQAGAQKQQVVPPVRLPSSQDRHAKATLSEKPLVTVSSTPQEELDKGRLLTRRSQKKRVQGVHGTFCYTSPNAQARFEAGILAVADLLAPSRVEVGPDVLRIQAGTQTRYVRTFTITGYGHHLLCGWVNSLHDLGLPLLVSSHVEPIDSRFMIRKLEQELTRLESRRLSDQKALRLPKADHTIEADQIRFVTHALASRKLKIFDVSMTICVHAGSQERVEQRSRYLLSHLRDMQIQARPATRQHDLAWQSCLPVGLDLLQQWVKLTSDVASTFLPGTSGTVGTPTGVFLGYSGSGLSRRPVYLNPWSADKKLANPHMVIIGETGQGKSWLGKTIATGLMGLGLADVCVLDKDDDYLPLHEALPGESQRYHLARSCPINLFDLPFGPADVDPDDPSDILAEFFDNGLLTGLSLLVTDEETDRRAVSVRALLESAYCFSLFQLLPFTLLLLAYLIGQGSGKVFR